MPKDIPLSGPDITEREIQAVERVLRSGRLSIGPELERFEHLIARRTDRTHAIGVSSGTAGLHLILEALNIGPGDEVVTTPFSFIASANCILYVGAKPVFVDIDPVSLNLNPDLIEAALTPKTKAIIAVEAFGNPAGMDQLARIAQRHEIPLIEDACEALGGEYKNRAIGSFGRAAVFGFYPNKQITTGEGGMIVTDDDRLANLCRSMRNQGRPVPPVSPVNSANPVPAVNPAASANAASTPAPNATGSWLQHERLGYNYRLSEINAAMGVVQMERLDDILAKRQRIATDYVDQLLDIPHLTLPTIDHHTLMSWFVFVVRLDTQYQADQRNAILSALRQHGIGCANYFPPIHLQPFYRERFGYEPGSFPITESVANRTIALPFYNQLDHMQIELIALKLRDILTDLPPRK